MPLTAVVLGATGLIGNHVLNHLLADNAFDTVRILVRRPVEIKHPKLQVQLVDFADKADFSTMLATGDVIFCAIGTTNAKVKGDKAAYRKIDHDIPVNAAVFAKQAGFQKFILVSSVGANAASGNFYLKLKGEVEQEITKLSFPALHIFRPSMLLGHRSEFRFGEAAVKWMMPFFNSLMFGSMKKYKGIHGETVAKAMIAAAKNDVNGKHIYHFSEIIALANHSN